MWGADLMERICARDNLRAALKRVRRNQGCPGVDGMEVEELAEHLRVHWPRIKGAVVSKFMSPPISQTI